MHAVKKPETVVRAVGVYEWTGDVAKPAASRLIPVTLFIDGSLQDAGVYLARPVPMALETGTIFELDQSGVPKGLLDLAFARHLQPAEESSAAPYDDGWFGYGQYKALPTPKLTPPSGKVRLSKGTVQSSKPDTARPHFSSDNKSPDSTANKSASTTANSDPDRPTMRRRDDSGSTSTSTPSASSSTPTTTASTPKPDDDPNRPTMKRRDDSASSTPSTPAASTTSPPSTPSTTASTSKSDDPDRPTMKRKSDSGSDSSSAGSSDSKTSSSDSDPDRPTMKRRSDSGSTTASSSTPADDPDRPTMKRRSDSGSDSSSAGSSDSKTSSSDSDPDRPTMKRRSDSGSTTASSDSPADDPDRPTLKKRSPAEKKAAQKGGGASVSEVGSLNDDPNRPNLHRGKPTHAMTDDDLPKLIGLPPDLHQMVAVSDAVDRPQHDFARAWESKEEQETVLGKMRDLARNRLKTYAGVAPASPPTKPIVVRTGAHRSKAVTPPPPPPLPLSDEVLKAYTLSYGGAPTYSFSASSPSPDGATVQYVTVIAQADANNDLRVALDNVTDSRHLDRTPRLRLVDVVDAEASNRASLLVELRAQHSRTFALYRLIGAQAEQVFSTGSTQ
ncbi:hypothetical protein FTO74_03515 [Granulicella sp. WH15]|uniref:hypothetical protein n=1 Tax=Granulicella sp. WH15 TaxID=2602070 RepID=UPI001366E4C8|nr:hypothetical protein [Granulicella sp. WH15]QHN02543.1 hypothetical protein FTO74_03515 [Granulicella sp. WH15]